MGATSAAPRVLMVVRLFHPWVGGTERQAHTLARGLVLRGADVRIVTGWWFRGTRQREMVDDIPVFRNQTLWEMFGIRGLRTLGGYLYMVTLAWHLWRTRRTYDVIHVHGMNYHSAVAVWAGRRWRRPTITKLANSGAASDVDKMRHDRQLRGARFLLSVAARSDRFVALNPAIVDELTSIGVPRARIASIPNGVRIAGTEPRSSYSISGEARVVFVGRLHEQKGLHTLLAAAAQLRDDALGGRGVTVDLVGEGPLRAELEARIAELHLERAVTLAGETGDVATILRQADVFVLPSRAEGVSNALLEAMAHGLPVVVSDVPGNRDVVDHDVNGLRFPVGDSDALADCVGRLVEDEDLRERLGCNARRTVESGFSLDRVVDAYLAMYDELIAETGTVSASARSR